MTPSPIRVFCPACGKWVKTNRPPGGLYFCPECQAEFPSDDNLANTQTFIRRLRVDREEQAKSIMGLGHALEKAQAENADLRRKMEETQAELDATGEMLGKTKGILLAELAKREQEPSGQQERDPEGLTIEIGRGLATLDIEFIQAIEKEIDTAMVHMGFSRVNSTKSGDFVKATYRQFGVCGGE